MAAKRRFHQWRVLPASEIARNSASVEEVAMVFCFAARQSIGPPYRVARYPSELCRLGKSPNAVSLAVIKHSDGSVALVLYFSPICCVWLR